MMTLLRTYPSPLFSRRGIDLDFPLLAACLALLGLGLVMITSASSEVASVQTGNSLYYMIRHLIYLLIGLGAAGVVLLIPLSVWQRLGGVLLCGAFALLLVVLIPGLGREVNGAMRWIDVGVFNVQPSEIAKVFVVIYLAGYLVRRQDEVRESWAGFFKPFVVLLPMAGLLLLEPDFGATVVMMGAAAAMLFLGGVGLFRFALMVALAVGAVFVLVQTQEYRLQRLITFTDPWADQFGSGYQLTQALIAFGRGEWLGVGLGNSIQKQFYLPEAHTDFVFAVLAEELGLVGAVVTVGLFFFVGVRALFIGMWAEQAKQFFAAYVAYGLAFLWIGQFLINVGVNVGLLPTKGLTLPFLSYGGSSLVICCVSLALLLRIEWERRTQLGSEDVEFNEADFALELGVNLKKGAQPKPGDKQEFYHGR
ncbi:MAG: putative lipid II flippase FtsW [Pseudomonas sp.]